LGRARVLRWASRLERVKMRWLEGFRKLRVLSLSRAARVLHNSHQLSLVRLSLL
jgi:hypothetical protein